MRFINAIRNHPVTSTSIALLFLLSSNVEKVNPQPSPNPGKIEAECQIPQPAAPAKPIVDLSSQNWQSVVLVRTVGDQEGTVNALLFTPDNKYIIGAGYRNQPNLKVWEIESSRRRTNVRAQRRGVQAIAIDPVGRTLVSAGQDGGINFWNWPDGRYIGIAVEHRTHVMDLAISPDGQILISGGLDGIKVWSLCDRRPLYTLTRLGEPSYAVATHPDGTTIASGDGTGKVKFWDIRQGVFLSELAAHSETIAGLLYTPDGKRLITSSEDRTVKVWDVESKRLLYTFTGHHARIRSIALHPNGVVLASASNDGVRLWNVETGEFLGWPEQCRDWVESVAFSADGRYLATGSFDFQVRLWQPSSLAPQPQPVSPPPANPSGN
jgi:WD40 repeat protein